MGDIALCVCASVRVFSFLKAPLLCHKLTGLSVVQDSQTKPTRGVWRKKRSRKKEKDNWRKRERERELPSPLSPQHKHSRIAWEREKYRGRRIGKGKVSLRIGRVRVILYKYIYFWDRHTTGIEQKGPGIRTTRTALEGRLFFFLFVCPQNKRDERQKGKKKASLCKRLLKATHVFIKTE